MQSGLPALYALFLWWFSTGIVLYLDGLPRRTFRWSLLGASALKLMALYGLTISAGDTSTTGAYIGFTCGLLIWGWQEMSYYTGFITGPSKQPCPNGCTGWRRFSLALRTSLYHELAIIAVGVLLLALTWGAPNQVGVWTYMILWWMRWSAKLNVFFGVRNLNEDWLPEHLKFLSSFFRRKPMNLFFPLSVTVATVIAAWLMQSALSASSAFEATGLTFLTVLLGLAILEHWFLVLPLPLDALWNWSLRSHQAAEKQVSAVKKPPRTPPVLNQSA